MHYNSKNTWKPPGFYEMPNILGSAYLSPDPPVRWDLRPLDLSKQITKRPWYPSNPHYEIPPLPPLLKHKSLKCIKKTE
ncbi:Putative STE/STE20 protein kinase [Rhizopus microsporus]|nr:Putative STE/STE20 protein kinase [Rhizopus microsporus]